MCCGWKKLKWKQPGKKDCQQQLNGLVKEKPGCGNTKSKLDDAYDFHKTTSIMAIKLSNGYTMGLP